MEYLIFEKISDDIKGERQGEKHPYIRTDVEPFESHWDAQKWIKNRCLNSSQQLSDFRIFEEYSITD